ncbi:MAG TPA: tail fiber domain-containing protein [Rhodothermales bacterium]
MTTRSLVDMHATTRVFPIALLVFTALVTNATLAQESATISYQGFLTVDGAAVDDPAATLTFRLFDAAEGGSAVWFEMHTGVAIEDGVFQVELGASTPLTGVDFETRKWLGVALGGLEAPLLEPRMPITAAPIALRARSLSDGAVVAGDNVTVTRSGDAVVVSAVVPDVDATWQKGGNAGIDPATDFIGTTDFAPFDVRVNGQRGLRIEPPVSSLRAPNVIGGYRRNEAAAAIVGATIAGGGDDQGAIPHVNRVFDDYGTIGGGAGNTAGNPSDDANDSGYATVVGGFINEASAYGATVLGGADNEASGAYATVAGGFSNVASGETSFAAGSGAEALHQGTFVWSGFGGGLFQSTGNDQFLIDAPGGVGIGTNAPEEMLHVLDPDGGSAIFIGGKGVNGPNGVVFEDDTENGGVQLFWRTDTNQFVLERQSTGSGSNPFDVLIYDATQDRFVFNAPIAIGVGGFGSTIYPTLDGGYSLGFSSRRWLSVYAVNGTINTSDARLKRDVAPIPYGLDALLRLRPVSFRWKEGSDASTHLGLIAQEVRDVIPESVVGDEATEQLGLNYSELIPVLIRAVQEQQLQIEALEARLAEVTRSSL